MTKLRVLSLFAGIGGFDLGLERTGGFRTVRAIEIDEHCRGVLAAHFPTATLDGDIQECQFKRGEADVICGGFPCQDISYAGKRAGLAGARSGLLWQMVRAIRVVRPKHVIVENVAGLSTNGLSVVLGTLAADGYDAEWDCVSASDVGAPHGRPRIWIAATDSDSEQRPHWRGSSIRRRQRGAQENAQVGSYANGQGQLQPPRLLGHIRRRIIDGAARDFWSCHWQAKFEALRRMDDGVPSRLDRSRDNKAVGQLGNAVVPQIPELIGRAILAAIAIEAATAAETVKLGSVHESAGPQDIAQTPSQSPLS